MKYYPHHIGDFDRATRHLTRIERSIYRDLIELYYDTEAPLTLDRKALCRKILARSDEESTAVEQTLNEFFTETQRGWYHERCEEEIARYRANNDQKSKAGKASALKKAAKREQALNARSTDVSTAVEQTSNGESTNQEPETINHEPCKQTGAARRFDPLTIVLPDSIPHESWSIWIAYRRSRKLTTSEQTMHAQVAKLVEWAAAGHNPKAIIEASISNGWQGLFEPKTNGSGKPEKFDPVAYVNRNRTTPGEIDVTDYRREA